MRKLLLATVALAIVGAVPAMAGGSVNFNLASKLDRLCTIAATNTDLTVGPAASATAQGDFETTCNFENADLHLTLSSGNGGLLNDVEGVTELYNLTFDGVTYSSTDLGGEGKTVTMASGAFANYPIGRSFVVALQNDLTIAGDYADVVTVEVAP